MQIRLDVSAARPVAKVTAEVKRFALQTTLSRLRNNVVNQWPCGVKNHVTGQWALIGRYSICHI